MTESDESLSRADIGLLFIAAVVTIPGITIITHGLFGEFGLTVTDITVSTLLTTALVVLYFRQTQMLESQRDLLTQEMNREARQQHTETLRERIREWHGRPESQPIDELTRSLETKLPSVGYSSFNSAPKGGVDTGGPDERPFTVVPHELEGDRYLEDLLDNHAKDLKAQKRYIEYLHRKFEERYAAFDEAFDEAIVKEREKYTLEPNEFFSRWVFNYLVATQRGKYDAFDEARDKALSSVTDSPSEIYGEESGYKIHATEGSSSHAVYAAFLKPDSLNGNLNLSSEIHEDGKETIEEVLAEVETERPYENIGKAASILEDAEDAIRELKHLLVEYDGRPIFTGDCKYLDEAKISPE